MSIGSTISFIWRHPLNRGRRLGALWRFARWQFVSSLFRQPVLLPMGGGGVLIVRRSDVGATGNYYCGLHDADGMLFVAHLLREGELFADVGANIGSYSVLAATSRGARVISCEPVGSTYQRLRQNVGVNLLCELVDARRIAVGDSHGTVSMTSGFGAMNHVVTGPGEAGSEQVELTTIDDILPPGKPRAMKIDVEGFELNVLRGGKRVFSESNLLGIVVELSGLGARYGVQDRQIDRLLREYGFTPCEYDPFSRSLLKLESFHAHGNTIYVREGSELTERLKSSKPVDVFGRLV